MELVEIDFTLPIEPPHLLSSTPLRWADLAGKVLAQPLEEGVSHPGGVLVVRDTHHAQLVRPDEDVAHVLRLLHTLPRPKARPLHQDLGGEGDEVLGCAALEKADTGEIVPSLQERELTSFNETTNQPSSTLRI